MSIRVTSSCIAATRLRSNYNTLKNQRNYEGFIRHKDNLWGLIGIEEWKKTYPENKGVRALSAKRELEECARNHPEQDKIMIIMSMHKNIYSPQEREFGRALSKLRKDYWSDLAFARSQEVFDKYAGKWVVVLHHKVIGSANNKGKAIALFPRKKTVVIEYVDDFRAEY